MKVRKYNESLNETFFTNARKYKEALVWLLKKVPAEQLAEILNQLPQGQLGLLINNIVSENGLAKEAEHARLGKETTDKSEMKALNPDMARLFTRESLEEDSLIDDTPLEFGIGDEEIDDEFGTDANGWEHW